MFSVLCFASSKELLKSPPIKWPTRHVKFQAGSLGHKPWDHLVSYSVKANFNKAVFDKLINVDASFELVPGLITSWSWNHSDSSYTFTINDQIKFDESRKLKPVDIEFSILKHFISSVSETDKRLFYNITGVDELTPNMVFKSGLCKGIKVLSHNKFKIFLNRANPNFLYSLGDIVSPIAPVEDFEKDYFTFNRLPRGTGPYRVVWSDPKTSLVRLERKKALTFLKSDLSPLSIDFLNHGDVQVNHSDVVTGISAKKLASKSYYKTVKGPMPIGIEVIDFNYTTPMGSNKYFRRAVSLAINREELSALSPFLEPHHEMIPRYFYGRSGLKFEFNPEKASKIVKKHLKSVSTQAKPLIGLYHGGPNEPKPKDALLIEKQLRRVGLYFQFKPDDGVYFKGDYKNAVLATYGSVLSFTDPLLSLSNYLPGTSAPENTDLKDKESIKILEGITRSKNKMDRHNQIRRMSKHFYSEIRQIPVGEIFQAYAISDRITDLNLNKSILVVDFTKIKMRRK